MVDRWLTFKTQVYLKKKIISLALDSSSFFPPLLVSKALLQPIRGIAVHVAYRPYIMLS